MTTVAVVDDEQIFRQGLLAWLTVHRGDIELVAATTRVATLISAGTPPPQVVVLDVLLRDGGSLADNIAALREWGAHVVVVTAGEPSTEMIRVALHEQALAFVHKGSGFEPICDAIAKAAIGEDYFNDLMVKYLHDQHPRLNLTARQIQILRLFVAGMTLVEVGRRLSITPDTVKDALREIRRKCRAVGLAAKTREDLRDIGYQYGYLDDW